ncbi:unnamed protein product [Sympodiomycopsis kandeliae]
MASQPLDLHSSDVEDEPHDVSADRAPSAMDDRAEVRVVHASSGRGDRSLPSEHRRHADSIDLTNAEVDDIRTPTPPPHTLRHLNEKQTSSGTSSQTSRNKKSPSGKTKRPKLHHPSDTGRSSPMEQAAEPSLDEPLPSSTASSGHSSALLKNVAVPSSGLRKSAAPSGPSTSSATSSNLAEQSSKALNAMLVSNLQRKDQVNEQLIQLMEGNAPPGTDPEWLRSSKQFLSTRIEEIRDILASRGRPSFSQSQTQSTSPGPSQRKQMRPSPRTASVFKQRSVSPVVIATSSIKGFSDDEAEASVDQTDHASPSLGRRQARTLQQQQQHQPCTTVSPRSPQQRQRNHTRSQTPTKRSSQAAQSRPPPDSRQIAGPSSEFDEFSSLDPALFDEDEEMLMAEIHGRDLGGANEVVSNVNSNYDGRTTRTHVSILDEDDDAGDTALLETASRAPNSAMPSPRRRLDASSRSVSTNSAPNSNQKRAQVKDQMNYMWSRDVAKALRRTFKLQEFRNNQLEAINATLNGDDVFCLMPTGGGKSLCYQLPALIDSGRTQGVTVVISPLLSLIHDQVRHLLDLTIPALMLTGDMQGPKRDFALSELFSKSPTTRLLYLTPEFVGRSRQAMDIFTHLHRNNLLARFVIDEAHCVSQWGHDFRPDYQTLGKLRQEYPQVPVMAMTATANSRVKADVVSSLGIKGCKVLAQSFNRANLRYEVREKNQKNVIQDIAKFIQASHKGQCGIVYCLSRRACEEVAEKLTRDHGLQAQHYHAALSKTDRLAIQEAWQAGKFTIIAATIAFGMGIDKGDVRFVVHHTIPQSLEGYYQETGRAGRDGKSSSCALYFSYKDTNVIKRMIDDGEGTTEQKEQQHANLRRVVQYCMNKNDCRRAQVLQYFGEVFPAEACHHTCDNCCNLAANHQTAVEQDLTSTAQKAAQLVSDLMGRKRGTGFTMLHFVDVFRGSQSRTIRERGHHTHRLAGAGSNLNRGDVERLFQDLTIRGVLNERSEVNAMGFAHAYLELGPEAPALLQGSMRIVLSVQRPSATNATGKDSNSSAASRAKPKRAVTAGRSAGLTDSEFETFDAFDISNVNLSPERASTNGTRQETASRPASRESGFNRTHSFDVGQAMITGHRSSKTGMSRSLILNARTNATTSARYGAVTIADDGSDDGEASRYAGSEGQSSRTNVGTSGNNDLTTACLEELVKMRDDLARRNQCRKAGIFDNPTLQRMAEEKPSGIAAFVAIRGVGDDKYESFGREFLSICKTYASRRDSGLNRFAFEAGTTSKVNSPGSNLNTRSPSYMQSTRPSVIGRESSNQSAARKRARMSDGSVVTVTAAEVPSNRKAGGRRSMM